MSYAVGDRVEVAYYLADSFGGHTGRRWLRGSVIQISCGAYCVEVDAGYGQVWRVGVDIRPLAALDQIAEIV